MAVWLVRAGKRGEREDFALERSVAVIGWEYLPDLGHVKSREDLEALCFQTYPGAKRNTILNHVRQLWAFTHRIEPKDLVVLPLKARSAIAIGVVTGPYHYQPSNPPDARHTLPVQWLETDLPRTAFDQDLLYSLGAFLTVCQIKRNNAEERIRAIVSGIKPTTESPTGADASSGEAIDTEAPLDLEEFGRDQISTYIGQKFRGHELTRLITALLRAQGYQTQMAPPGADGGVDIIAGRGPLGFDPPRLCVQVKSSDEPLSVGPLRELQGVLRHFGADQGLLVAWGGFRQSVINEARRLFFEIRLWDAGTLVDMVLQYYGQLPADIRTELPLKSIWTLVLEE
jgi:restriction system protein